MLVGFSPSIPGLFCEFDFGSRGAKPAGSQALLEPAEGRREQRFCLSPLGNKCRGKGKMATGLFVVISQKKRGEGGLIKAVVQ